MWTLIRDASQAGCCCCPADLCLDPSHQSHHLHPSHHARCLNDATSHADCSTSSSLPPPHCIASPSIRRCEPVVPDHTGHARRHSILSDTPSLASSPSNYGATHACQWAGCDQKFSDHLSLVSHVNDSHLMMARSPSVASSTPLSSLSHGPSATPLSAPNPNHANNSSAALKCLWDSCPAASMAGAEVPFTGLDLSTFEPILPLQNQQEAASIIQHLLKDHLGIGMNHPPSSLFPSSPAELPELDTTMSSSASTKSGGSHVCGWDDCKAAFDSSADLMVHISADHVGSGKAEYFCRWSGCERAAQGRGFAQRQKVMRHIQTHTGECHLHPLFYHEPDH
jgi:hypothetical protein